MRAWTIPPDWADDLLDARVLEQVGEIVRWARHQDRLTVLFDGPGPGKRLAAALLGQALGIAVRRIDLSKRPILKRIVFKKGAILFFDEADALFAKRSSDRAANQQTAYLLQRIEDFPGIVILATNLRSQIDEAFARRFRAVIHFKGHLKEQASSRARSGRRPSRGSSPPRRHRGRSRTP